MLAIWGACVGLVVGIFAWLCARRWSYRVFVGGVSMLGVAAAVYFYVDDTVHYAESDSRGRLYAVFNSLFVAPVAALFFVSPGLLVKRRASLLALLTSSIITTIVASPFWLLYGLVLGCVMGIDCR